ncbi:hypothetical protein J2W17_000772 [Pseudomonas lini]|nr:hypothetical protein [Pseudomonas lini]
MILSNGRPQVLAECPDKDGGPDPLFQDYLKGLYLLDPCWQSWLDTTDQQLEHRCPPANSKSAG